MTVKEKCAYIKGLAEGLSLDESKPESRLISELISLVTDMADEIETAQNDIGELNEYVEELDHDLGDVESYVFDCDDDECDCCDDDDDDWDECDDCDCDDCEGCDDDYYEIECPHCGETVCFEEGTEPEDMICPACNKKFSDAD